MKKKLILPVLLMLASSIFLSSCIPILNVDKVKKFPVYGNYRIVGGGAATHGEELKIIDSDLIRPAIKKTGQFVGVNSTQSSTGVYCGNYYCFFYKFFYEATVDDEYDRPYCAKYAFGYVDLFSLDVTVLDTFERVEPNYTDYNYRVHVELNDGGVLYINDEGRVWSLDTDTLEYVVFSFDSEYTEQDNPVFYGLCGEWLVYSVRLEDGYTRKYYAVNYKTNEFADNETLAALVKEAGKEPSDKEKTLHYKEREFILEKTDNSVTLTERQTDESFVLTLEDMREKSEEFRKVEKMNEVELSFNNVIAQNGEIYISACYYNPPFFGMHFFSKSTAVLCYLYIPETSEVRYIGWLRADSGLNSVVKL